MSKDDVARATRRLEATEATTATAADMRAAIGDGRESGPVKEER